MAKNYNEQISNIIHHGDELSRKLQKLMKQRRRKPPKPPEKPTELPPKPPEKPPELPPKSPAKPPELPPKPPEKPTELPEKPPEKPTESPPKPPEKPTQLPQSMTAEEFINIILQPSDRYAGLLNRKPIINKEKLETQLKLLLMEKDLPMT